MYEVTFWVYSNILGNDYINVETHNSMESARIRAAALGWTIQNVVKKG